MEIKEKTISMKKAVAIDGPGGAGKSTVARLLAKELGFIYVDTGAMYRAVGLYCLNHGIDPSVESQVVPALDNVNITIKFHAGTGEQRIFLNGDDVTERIRLQDAADASSKVAVMEKVREKLVDMQRDIACENDVVMDGRDIGSHVLPDAALKIYMDAAAEVRARRRLKELEQKGVDADFNEVLTEIKDRDFRDMNRIHSPLIKAEDAVVVDTGALDAQGVKNLILEISKNRKLI